MSFKGALGSLLTAIGEGIVVITEWIGIAADWTHEAKELSDATLENVRKEREVDTKIAISELEKRLAEKITKAGLDEENSR